MKNRLLKGLAMILSMTLAFTGVSALSEIASGTTDTFARVANAAYEAEDFMGTWEGEYAGSIGSTSVQRHFVLVLDNYDYVENNTYTVYGTFSFSASNNAAEAAKHSAKGSYKWKGTVNLDDGSAKNMTGNGWLDQPSGFTYITFNGALNSSKIRMEGTSDNGTFWCDLVGEISHSKSVRLSNSSTTVDLLKTDYSIAKGSSERVTIMAQDSASWNGENYGKAALVQDGREIEYSETGSFVDIVPGEVFKAGKQISVVFKDANGTVVDTTNIRLNITEGNTGGNNNVSTSINWGYPWWTNVNTAAVSNGPSVTTQFSVPAGKTVKVSCITLYHWNNSYGATPGTITLSKNGSVVGTWQSTSDRYIWWWDVFPDLTLTEGTYTVICSDTSTWSHNSGSGNAGFVEVYGTESGSGSSSDNNTNTNTDTNNDGGKPAQTKIKSMTVTDDGYLVIKFKKITKNIYGYEVQIGYQKKFNDSNSVTATVDKNKATFKNLQEGKKYFVRVRAYNKVNGIKKYGKWSKTKSIVYSTDD